MKKRFRKMLMISLFLVPTSAVAFFGTEDAILSKILVESVFHTKALKDIFSGIDFLSSMTADIREGVGDPLDLVIDQDYQIKRVGLGPILGTINDIKILKQNIENLWGRIPKTIHAVSLSMKDDEAIHALGAAVSIADEAKSFTEAGEELLQDLDGTREGKATIRNAQAGAIQVQQLGQIEANQALQISLAAQDILSKNEEQKAFHELNHRYLNMLDDAFSNLKPMGAIK